ncbi:MAG TPA: DoxX family protein [Candidatus Paceibacterota bacterium]
MFSKLVHCSCTKRYSDFAYLIMRIVLGIIFVWHGYDKIFVKGLPTITGFLGTLSFPLPAVFAYILSYGELVVGLLLIIGLFTHWAAKFVVIVASVAFFTVHIKNGFSIGNGGYEYIILIFAAAISILATSAGRYSIDNMIFKNKNVCDHCGK